MISVVIPYFQRSTGVLRKALLSILAQQKCLLSIHIIVVDDASPIPASAEVLGLALPTHVTLQVITQANGGPGAARNAGLDAVADATTYLAFLDSDDEWSVDHLARATAALDAGYDFFFADHLQLGQDVGAFKRAGRIDPAKHRQLTTVKLDGLYEYVGDVFDQILRANVVGTSTVVFRWHKFGRERFLVEFTTAGEDYLFWMSLCSHNARTAFSNKIEATYGRGVNVFSGSGWGTEGYLLRTHQEIKYRKAVESLFKLDPTQQQRIHQELKRLRKAFASDILHRLRHRKGLPTGLLTAHRKVDFRTFMELPANIIEIVLRRGK